MARGRDICNTLKAIRKQIADANGIAYSPEECHFTGELSARELAPNASKM